jgi:cysteinyl-tRNA synthetase
MNEVEKKETTDLAIATELLKSGSAIVTLANKLVSLSTEDRTRSVETFNYIKQLVEKVERDNSQTDQLLNTLTSALGKELGAQLSKAEIFELVTAIGCKKDSTRLLEQLNKSLETSIGSSNNLVKLTELLVKMHEKSQSKRSEEETSAEDDVVKTRASLI